MSAPLCINCGKKLRRCKMREYLPDRQWGDYGDGHLCGLRCAYAWAVMYLKLHPEYAAQLHIAMAEIRLKEKSKEHP